MEKTTRLHVDNALVQETGFQFYTRPFREVSDVLENVESHGRTKIKIVEFLGNHAYKMIDENDIVYTVVVRKL